MILRRSAALPVWPSAVHPLALALAFLLPFAAIPPVLVTPWLALTDDKLVLLGCAVAWLLTGARARPTAREWRALAPTLALLAVAVAASVLAPDFHMEALKFVWRLVAAAFVLLVTLRLAGEPRYVAGLLWAIVAGAGVSALLGLAEASGGLVFEPILSLFKVAPTRVGGEVRVSASFQYATIAAMYFEMAIPLAIVLAATARRRSPRLVAMAIAVLCTLNVVLSLTRAGLLTLGVVFGVLLLVAFLRRGVRRVVLPTALSLGVMVGGVAILAMRDPVFKMRLASESDADWYGAAYSAPNSLQVEAGQAVGVAVDVTNEGRMAWSSSEQRPFALGYRWLTADGTGVLDVAPGEMPLPHDVVPGETIRLQAQIMVPGVPAGIYRLDWGMLQRDVLQFYERGWADAQTVVDVRATGNGLAVDMPLISPRDDGEAPWVVGRLELWGAALRMVAAHPLLGVGPDNFRHLYGAQLGLETWDERVQANNLYLELLADTGLLGLAAFGWVVAGPLRRAARSLDLRHGASGPSGREVEESPLLNVVDTRHGAAERRASCADSRREHTQPGGTHSRDEHAPSGCDAGGHDQAVVALGLGLAVVAFLGHGLLDSFLAFAPTALLLWLLFGLLLAQKPQVSGR
ncbi:MAG: O-antigen ligase family protein [Chloroflexi bacterium]|nr:O-antigen ligase family protein [Chloroflexota bacterium]